MQLGKNKKSNLFFQAAAALFLSPILIPFIFIFLYGYILPDSKYAADYAFYAFYAVWFLGAVFAVVGLIFNREEK